jgi:hypothetical protein
MSALPRDGFPCFAKSDGLWVAIELDASGYLSKPIERRPLHAVVED